MQHSPSDKYDVAVVGRGIVGLAHALAAARTGARVVVIDRHARAVGATIRNFGFVTVTGQERSEMWPLAMRARDVWAEVAAGAGIPVLQTGLVMHARRPAAAGVLEEFMATEMGEGCRLLNSGELAAQASAVPFADCAAALVSPHELRIESREAVPLLASWLEQHWGVKFLSPASVIDCEGCAVLTADGEVLADRVFICPGDDLTGLFPKVMARHQVSRCKLNMLRLANPGFRLPHPVMSDLGLVRYEGYSAMPAAATLRAQLEAEQAAQLAAGIHLIAVQSADGTLVVGDSHEYGDAPDPFQHEAVDALILQEYAAVFGATPRTVERWVGTYAVSPLHNWFTEEAAPGVHVTVVTCGAGMSTAFAIAEQVVGAALGVTIKELVA